jgi:UMF1 family MFS transporter
MTADSAVFDRAGEARVVVAAPARERWSWALFDFANTIFSMNVASLYFGVWLVSDLGASNTTYALSSAVASVLIILALPALGAMSDARRRRKNWVVGFALLSGAATVLIGILGYTTVPLVGQEVINPATLAADWRPGFSELKWVLAAFVLANFAYQAALPFYNAMLPELVPAKDQGRMSGIGVAMGYVGSIVGVIMVMPFFTGGFPMLGRLSDGVLNVLHLIPFTDQGGRASTFVPTGLLFLAFSVPLIIFCKDHDPAPGNTPVKWREAFGQLKTTLADAKNHPGVVRFLLTTFLYQDAVGTIIGFMAVYAVRAIGFEEGSETTLFIVLTVPAILGSYIYGRLTDRWGPKRALSTTLLVWVFVLLLMIAAPTKAMFWAVGFLIGLNFGGVNTVERPLLLSLVPDAMAGRYFSLMVLSARAAAIAGPIIWSLIVDSTEGPLGTQLAYRLAVGFIALMFLAAWWLLKGVPDKRPGTPMLVSS